MLLPDHSLASLNDRKLQALQLQHQQLLLQQQQQILATRQQLLLQQHMRAADPSGLDLLRGAPLLDTHLRSKKSSQELALSMQSRLLTEFKNSKNKKMELKVKMCTNPDCVDEDVS